MSTREKIKLTSYDELLGVHKDGTVEVEISELYPFKNHPFKVLDDEKMEELATSIKENGILSPVLVRTRESGGYELISGHRRKRACELSGIDKMPAIVKELNDDEATIIMVDANIQREEILPSEKAYAYKMKMEAISHQGKSQNRDKESAEIIGEDSKVSGRQVQRYIRLTLLIPELLKLVDEKKITMALGIQISYLDEEFQKTIYKNIVKGNKVTKESISSMRNNSEDLTIEDIEGLLNPEKVVKKLSKITLNETKLARYFDTDYSAKDMEEIIFTLLDRWKEEGV